MAEKCPVCGFEIKTWYAGPYEHHDCSECGWHEILNRDTGERSVTKVGNREVAFKKLRKRWEKLPEQTRKKEPLLERIPKPSATPLLRRIPLVRRAPFFRKPPETISPPRQEEGKQLELPFQKQLELPTIKRGGPPPEERKLPPEPKEVKKSERPKEQFALPGFGVPSGEEAARFERAKRAVEEQRRREREPVGGPPGRPGPPTPPEGRREEREVWVRIQGKVIDPKNKPLKDVTVVATGGDSYLTDSDGSYSLIVPANRPIRMVAQKDGYTRPRRDVGPFVPSAEPYTIEPPIKLEPTKPETKGFSGQWTARKRKPLKETIKGEFLTHFGWGGLIWAAVFAVLLFIFYNDIIGRILEFFGLKDFFLLNSPILRFGIPLAIALFVYFAYRAGGSWKVIKYVLPIALVYFLVFFVLDLHKIGDLINFDWYVNRLDLLKWIGVSQQTIDNMKDGVRSTLSFLKFKGAEPAKPEAKKIGGFEAIQLKFGSRYNNYILPTLFARMNYTLPISVTNPNKFDTKLVVGKFTIDSIFLINGSNRIMCGTASDETGNPTGKITSLGDISPEEEKSITIDFGNKTYCKDVIAASKGYPVGSKDYNNTNPMFPVKLKIFIDESKKDKECTESSPSKPIGDTDLACVNQLQKFYDKYSVYDGKDQEGNPTRAIATSADVTATYKDSEHVCECKLSRYYNIMDELCFLGNNKAKVELQSSYDFKVQGKGELILVRTGEDRKLAPKPTITSSAGPLTVTTYFVSDAHVFEPVNAPKTKIMFIEIKNDGDGNAKIKGVSINGNDVSKITLATPIPLLPPDKVKITSCSPEPTILSVNSKESVTIICNLDEEKDSSIVTGGYKTLPAILDVDYTYLETHSTTINAKKETIPDGLEIDRVKELDTDFKPLPYYCPTMKVPGSDTAPLKIYDFGCSDLQEQMCKQVSNCIWYTTDPTNEYCKDK